MQLGDDSEPRSAAASAAIVGSSARIVALARRTRGRARIVCDATTPLWRCRGGIGRCAMCGPCLGGAPGPQFLQSRRRRAHGSRGEDRHATGPRRRPRRTPPPGTRSPTATATPSLVSSADAAGSRARAPRQCSTPMPGGTSTRFIRTPAPQIQEVWRAPQPRTPLPPPPPNHLDEQARGALVRTAELLARQ